MLDGLVNELRFVGYNKRLRGLGGRRRDPVDQVAEDDGFASACGEGDAEAFLAFCEVVQDGLDDVLLVRPERRRGRVCLAILAPRSCESWSA